MSDGTDFLRHSEEQFRFLVQNASDIVAILSANGALSYISLSVQQILGHQPARLLGKSVIDLVHPDDSAIAQELLQKTLAQPATHIAVELRLQHKNGAWQDFEVVFNNHLAEPSVRGIVATCHDITDRKRSAELLQRYQLLSTSTNDIVLFIQRDGQILEANDAAIHAYGYPREKLLTLKIKDLRSPTACAQITKQISQSNLGGLLFETVHCRQDGSLFPVEVSSKGTVINQELVVLNIIRDITPRKQAEDELRQTQKFLQTMIDHLPVAVFVKEQQGEQIGTFRLWNKASELIFGISAEQAVGKTDYDIFPKAQADLYRAQDLSCIQQKMVLDTLEDFLKDSPKEMILHTIKVPVLDETSQTRHLLCISKDITESRCAEKELQRLYQQVQELNASLEQEVQLRTAQLQRSLDFEALLKRITDKVRDSLDESQIIQTAVQALALGLKVYSCDTGIYDLEAGTSLICNEYIQSAVKPAEGTVVSFSDYVDVYKPLLAGQPIHFCWRSQLEEATRPNSQHFTLLACPMIDDQGVLGDLWLAKSANTWFDEAEVRLVEQVANQCAIAIRQARLYQAAQQQVEELERLNKLKDDFLNTVSHELRTPMSNIKMATQMLEVALNRAEAIDLPFSELPSVGDTDWKSATSDKTRPSAKPETQDAEVRHYFQILYDECQREINLINDLLDLSRLESGTEPLVLSQIDPRYWIPSIAEPFIIRTTAQQQQLRVEIADDLPLLTTDLSILGRILTELIGNACKYTPAGESITLIASNSQLQLNDAPVCSTPTLQICVVNTGIEISLEERDRIFDKFYRIPNSDPWKHGGTGLGLALAKRMVKHLSGTIHLESGSNQTAFIVHLPR